MLRKTFYLHLILFIITITIANFAISDKGSNNATFCFLSADGLKVNSSSNKYSAMVEILSKTGADVIMLSDVADKEALEKLRGKLNNYTYSAVIKGNDPLSHLAVLARIKPVNFAEINSDEYKIKNRKTGSTDKLKVKRGFIYGLFKFDDYKIHLFGAHLKDRSKNEFYNQTDMRRYEGRLLRSRINKIMKKEPKANILVLGNFNDTCGKSTIKDIYNRRFGIPKRLFDVRPLDSYRTSWTHWNASSDEYERIDYALSSSSLIPEIKRDQTYILHDPKWSQASSHRPIVINIITDNHEMWSKQKLSEIYPNTIYEAQAGHFIESKKVGKSRKRNSPLRE